MVPGQPPLVVLAGPTGSGKSEIAVELAARVGGEIVNYDSVQLYRDFDIGSAKPGIEAMQRIPHHLYGVADPADHITAADWAKQATGVVDAIRRRGAVPILAGGTFFYLRAFLSGLPEMPQRDEQIRERLRGIIDRGRGVEHLRRLLRAVDPVSWGRIPPGDRNRLERALEVWLLARRPISSYDLPDSAPRPDARAFILEMDRDALKRRLDIRVEAMYRSGLVEETRRLLTLYPSSARAFGSIGYREAVQVVSGELSEEQAIAETRRRTRAYAKRQLTWLRSERGMHSVRLTGSAEAAAIEIHEHLQDVTELT